MKLIEQDVNLEQVQRILGNEPGLGPVFVSRDDGVCLMVILEHDGYLAYTIGTDTDPADQGRMSLEDAINNPIR